MNPITPDEAKALRRQSIPDFVIEIVNDLIVQNLNSECTASVVEQNTIVAAIYNHPDYLKYDEPRPNIFRCGWLDFEDCFRYVGWKVKYERPCIGDGGSAYFEFSR